MANQISQDLAHTRKPRRGPVPLPPAAGGTPAAAGEDEGSHPQVLALVGTSGTGKSYRATRVAHEFDADLVIDDGLLVKEGKILAGRSAKAELTRVAAIRRAIFAAPDHAAEVKNALAGQEARRLLILGTSLGMVGRITVSLGLPPPGRVIRIEDIASQREIWRARRIRREQGKHVIPATTLEVRKTFKGYLIDPLRFFLRAKGERRAGLIVEKSVVRPTWSSLGRFYINDTVVMSIALHAARDVPGIARPLRAIVESKDDGTVIDLDLAVLIDTDVVDACRTAQLRVRKIVEYTTGLNLLAVNVHARTMLMPEGAPERRADGPSHTGY